MMAVGSGKDCEPLWREDAKEGGLGDRSAEDV